MDNIYALLYEYKMEELSILESYMFEPIDEGAIIGITCYKNDFCYNI